MIDKDKIFELFEEDNKVTQNFESKENIVSNFKLKMFVKLISNHNKFYITLSKLLSHDPSYDESDAKGYAEFIVYNRSWEYLKRIDLNNKNDLFVILDYDNPSLYETLEMALTHFESEEEYEKCAHINNILKVLKESKR